jgi:hypothetical protein
MRIAPKRGGHGLPLFLLNSNIYSFGLNRNVTLLQPDAQRFTLSDLQDL